jgi:3-isopropylmalate/(R)-2-methylmalate dehydratase large subunit
MASTLAEKILAAHCDREQVSPGEYIQPRVDFVVGNEGPSRLAIEEFRRLGCDRIFNKERVTIITDHSVPNKTIDSAEVVKICRDFADEYELPLFYEVGRLGISHVMVPEQGFVGAGDVVVGSDSHVCTYGALGAFATGMGSTDMLHAMVFGDIWMRVPETMKVTYTGKLLPYVGGKDLILALIAKIGIDGANYKALEFYGGPLGELSMDSRFTLANMTIEAGAKCGLFTPDKTTVDYMERCKRPYRIFKADEDAAYQSEITIDVSGMEPVVATPHLPENVRPAIEVEKEGVRVDQVFIGSCTNGRLEDIRIAAELLKGRSVNPKTRMVVLPGSQDVYLEALRAGYIETLIESGVAVGTPSCGPCVGGHMGVLASGETCLSTSNRNFQGRMGSKDSFVYLAGPAVAAATAVTGYVTSPASL